MSERLRVVITTEGTYPYCTGGVSTWADILIKELGDIDFYLMAIMMHPYQSIKFELPANVLQLINVPLWGTEEPTEYISGQSLADIYLNKRKGNDPIEEDFKGILEHLVCSIYESHPDFDVLGQNLLSLYDICADYDYRNIFRSEWLWKHFYRLMLEIHQRSPLYETAEFAGREKEAGPSGAAVLLERIRERWPVIEVSSQGVGGLNLLLQTISLWELVWGGEAPEKLPDELRALEKETRSLRASEWPRLTFMEKRRVEVLNRLLIEEILPELSPRYRDKPYQQPSIYDFVENLRWIYRFLITILAPLPEAEVYHSSAAAFCGLPCIIAKLKFGSKFLLTEHGIYVREQYLYASREKFPPHTKRFLMGLITVVSRLNYHFADRILPVCRYNKRWELQFRADEEKIEVIYNGIDTERFRHLEIERSSRPTVVMVARIDPLKDIETFIRTCAEVKRSIGDILFKLYGPRPDEEYFQKCLDLVRELDLEGNLEFAGLTLTPEIANNEGDIVLLTSISEAFPFSVIEAMACEKLVISSDVGGTSEVLEGHGFVVQPRNHNEFAKQVIEALGNPALCAELGVEARRKVLQGFKTSDMVQSYRKIYHDIAERSQ